jgi:taurine--2-oxoglutarate transaminase
MAGWGRTGKWFAVDHWGVEPDILVTAKGITSAYIPLGLCATTTAIANYFEEHYFSHGHTYEAHPLTVGPAIATIEEMQRLNLVERAASLEPYVRGKLEALKAKHVSIGDLRGLGLFFAVELVKNRTTKQGFNTMRDKVEGKPLVVDQIAAKMMVQGVSIQSWVSHFVIAPPLIVTKEELDLGIAALDEHLAIADALVE